MKPKNTKQEMDRERGAWSVERGALTLHSEIWTFHAPRSTLLPASRAFTLIEMLVVIAVISLLAAMIFPITGAITRTRIRTKARSEMEQIATGIENYKSKLGHYPPDNNPSNLFTNQLYFELMGTTNDDSYYFTRDGSARIKDSVNNFRSFLGPATAVNGFVNSTKKSGGDEARTMTTFLPGGVKPTQIGEVAGAGGDTLKVLACSIPAPVDSNNPNGLNPWRYNSSNPTNNPNSFDLWVDVVISGKTNRICNWSKDPLIVSRP